MRGVGVLSVIFTERRLMSTNATLVVVHPELSGEHIEILGRALQRRGWQPLSTHAFRQEQDMHQDDKQIVKQAERDLRQAEYVAGLHGLEAVCLVEEIDEPSRRPRRRSRT
jgi:hypothetical protein